MHFFIIFFIGFALFIWALVSLVPITATWASVYFLGKRAKFSDDDKGELYIIFYFAMGGLMALMVSIDPSMGFWAKIFSIPILFFFWPIGAGFAILGATSYSDTIMTWACLGISYAITQYFAIQKVVERSRKEQMNG